MVELWNRFIEYATANELFAGLIGASVIGGLLVSMRSVPRLLWSLFLRQCTVVVEVSNTDQAFYWLAEWLSSKPYSLRARRLLLTSSITGTGDVSIKEDESQKSKPRWFLLPGEGTHWFFYHGRPILITREIEREQSRGTFLRERITFRVFGRNQTLIRRIIDEAISLRFVGHGIEVKLFTGKWWQSIGQKPPRSAETVILPNQQLESLIEDTKSFLSSSKWYSERGIPYRRGYLFTGPPGTGKTSVVMVLATVFKRALYILNLGGLEDDNDLVSAFLDVPRGAFLLVEDVDVILASHRRRKINSDGEEKEVKGVTISALLNCIDGIMAQEGRLLIMTTNYPDKLDPALVRPGRADRIEKFDLLEREDGIRLYQRLLGTEEVNKVIFKDWTWPKAAAEIQQSFMINHVKR